MLCSALLCLRRPAWRHCPAATGALHNKDGDELPVSALCLAFQRAREAVTAVTAITFRRRTASCAMSGSAQVSQARSNQSLLPEQKAALLALPSETAVSAHADVTTLRQHQIVEGFPYVNHQSIVTATHAPARAAPGLQAC